MRLKLAVLDNDLYYLNGFSKALGAKYANEVELTFFTDETLALSEAVNGKFDMLVAGENCKVNVEKLSGKCAFAYLTESAEADTVCGQAAISKYQHTEQLYEQILNIHSKGVLVVAAPVETPKEEPVIVPPVAEPVKVQPKPQAKPVAKKKKGKALPIVLAIVLLLLLIPAMIVGVFIFLGNGDVSETDITTDTSYTEEYTTAEEVFATTAAITEETLPTEATFADGSRETYAYSAEGNVTSKTVYDANGNFVARYDYTYSDDALSREKQYNEAGKLVKDTILNEDGGKIVTEREYDAESNMTGGTTVYTDANGIVREVHTLNKFDGITDSVIYDEQGEHTATRQYHFTAAGYGDGYTETDASGKSTRYNEDGTVRKEPEKPVADTTKATTTATTTKTTTAATTANPAEPTVYTEETRVGSDRVVKYYNVAADGKKTLSNTITYRTINGKEVVLTNIDEIRGYGRQNEYDAKGNLTSYLTYNVKYGKRTTEIKHNADGSVVYTKTYEYNNEGKRIRENQYDASDNLTGYITYEYIVKNDGSYKTKIVTYDANGKILSSVVR